SAAIRGPVRGSRPPALRGRGTRLPCGDGRRLPESGRGPGAHHTGRRSATVRDGVRRRRLVAGRDHGQPDPPARAGAFPSSARAQGIAGRRKRRPSGHVVTAAGARPARRGGGRPAPRRGRGHAFASDSPVTASSTAWTRPGTVYVLARTAGSPRADTAFVGSGPIVARRMRGGLATRAVTLTCEGQLSTA